LASRGDIGIVVGDLEPAEFAVTAAGEQGELDEIAECTLAAVEKARDLVAGEVAN
jgi:hypothetical protein